MPPKRPTIQIAPAAEQAVCITNTMTLVVRGANGEEIRVKEGGIAPVSGSAVQAYDMPVMNALKFDDLRIGQEIGKGAQGKVRVVQHKTTGERYALKYLTFVGDIEQMRLALQSELRQVEALKHANIVSSYEAFFRDGKLFIVLEYMNAGTMNDVIKRHPLTFTEEKIAFVARELLKGINHLHKSNIVHRDLKPANVLANSKGEVKISDFGVATKLSSESQHTLSSQGSVPYMSPERVKSLPYSFSCDIWSAGLTVAECALGQYPFVSLKSKMFELCQALGNSTARVSWEAAKRDCSTELKDFVNSCLLPVESRPTAEQLLQHQFLLKADIVNPREIGEWFISSDDPCATESPSTVESNTF
jgi:mitogen-activated protein kinase kinase 1